MKQGVRIEQLLHWRLALAERHAPSPPHALAPLVAMRPWWEHGPERFQAEYRDDAALTNDVASSWEAPNVTDRVPFRMILEPTDRARSE